MGIFLLFYKLSQGTILMLKCINRLKLLSISWKLLIGFCVFFSTSLLISSLAALYYLTAEPPEMACYLCVGCPCAYTEYIAIRDYYLNFLFPRLAVVMMIPLSFCIALFAIQKLRYEKLKLTTIRRS